MRPSIAAMLALGGCLFANREPPCADGYVRSGGSCVALEGGATSLGTTACEVAFDFADFGCEGTNVVVTANTACVTAGTNGVDLLETGAVDGRAESHDLRRWNVDPTGTWEQLEVVLDPTGTFVENEQTAFDCVVVGEPVITVVLRSWDRGALVDCAIRSNDPTGPQAVFDGTAPGWSTLPSPQELTEANCHVLQ